MMNRIVKPAIILASIAFASSLLLSHVQKITYPRIVRQQKEKQQKALAVVLPGYLDIEKKSVIIDGKDFTFWKGTRTEEGRSLTGYAFITSSAGYSGDIQSMVGINGKGEILGLSILQQTETPGLGARCQEIASSETLFSTIFGDGASDRGETRPWFQIQFNDIDAFDSIKVLKIANWDSSMHDELRERNAVSAITGATITSRAVAKGVEKGIALLREALEKSGEGPKLNTKAGEEGSP